MDTLLLQLTLWFATGRSLSPLTLATAVAEADSLWSPHGVSIHALEDCSAPVFSPVIRVSIAESLRPPIAPAPAGRRREPQPRAALGAITFGGDGAPSPLISVFLGDIVQLVAGARVLGAQESQWPATMRERILGRVIGRVLAHEIGHYLLRTRDHGRAGLMRPVHATLTLVAPERKPFTLSKPEALRLARLARPQPEAAR